MASRKYHPLFELKVAVSTALLICFLITFSTSKSVSAGAVAANDTSGKQDMMKKVLGSKPPKCLNRCFSCRPCMATLVASPHHRNGRSSSYQGDESYYLLAWKCKCGDKLYQP